jgi:DNA gyrase subunit A
MRYPLVDGQGNFGSVDGDSAAAMRYTEAHDAIAHRCHGATWTRKRSISFPTTTNPHDALCAAQRSFRPCWSTAPTGIAVGMATNIPPHNMGRFATPVKAIIDKPDMEPDEMQLIPGPRLPHRRRDSRPARHLRLLTTGRGIMVVRAGPRWKRTKTGSEPVISTELPYQVNKAALIEKIANLVKNKQLDGIRYVRDESDREGMRIALGLKKNQVAGVIINKLYKHTQMENTFGIIFLAVVNKQPEIMDLKGLLEHFILHRKEIIVRRTRFELKKAEARAHILEGLKIALDHLDRVVALIRSFQNSAGSQGAPY